MLKMIVFVGSDSFFLLFFSAFIYHWEPGYSQLWTPGRTILDRNLVTVYRLYMNELKIANGQEQMIKILGPDLSRDAIELIISSGLSLYWFSEPSSWAVSTLKVVVSAGIIRAISDCS